MPEPLVTIIVPCYNMEKKIQRLFDSIFNQTYKQLYVVVVDDGSTDHSKQVILDFQKRMQQRFCEVEYVYKDNGGPGSAINVGLKYIKGDYFCWPDADDWLSLDSIKKRVNFLEENREYAMVRSDAFVYEESNLIEPIYCVSKKRANRFKETNLFEDYILERNVFFCPGCFMVRTSSYRDANPRMEIFEGRFGQNYQLLLPLVYHFRVGFIDECLYHYVIYKGSLSHSEDWYINSYKYHEEIIIETLKQIKMAEGERLFYEILTKQKYLIKSCLLALRNGDNKRFNHNIDMLDNNYFCYFGASLSRIMMAKPFSHIPGSFVILKYIYRLFGVNKNL